uniref:Glycoprotein n=1 Tax=Emaravirus cajani TaxID=1980429 RepID=A0A0U5K3I4_9VIRU|nr:Glycoprotein precursor [Emaravirus cajani]
MISKYMSVLNCAIALLIILAMASTMINSSKVTNISDRCVCRPKILRFNKDYIACFESCEIKPITDYLFNTSCISLSGLTIAMCKDEKYIITKPTESIGENYTWILLFNKLWKIAMTIMVWLSLFFAKVPFMYTMQLISHLAVKFSKSKKRCKSCDRDYIISHIDCPPTSPMKRTDFNIVFYTITILFTMATFVNAGNPSFSDDNEYNYYAHGGQTEIQVLDKEHYKQDFSVNGYLYTFTIENSHLELKTTDLHEILGATSHYINGLRWSCDGHEECNKIFKKELGIDVDFSIKKSSDGLSCLFTTATICGTCVTNYKPLGWLKTVVTVTPYIDILVKHGESEELIQIREFNEYIHKPYYVKPIPSVEISKTLFFTTGHDVYTGQFCTRPSIGCFGPNYKKDGKVISLRSPLVKDPMTHDREVILEHCDDPGNSDIESLEKTGYRHHNNSIIMPYSFGMISIGVPLKGKLVGDFCSMPVDVKTITVDGCYDCQNGFSIKVDMDIKSQCGQIICLIGRIKKSYYIDAGHKHIEINSFFDNQDIIIECNNYKKQFKLQKSTETSRYVHSNAVHGEAEFDFNIWDHLPNLLLDLKKMGLTILAVLIVIYMIYMTGKRYITHVFDARRKYKYIRAKKDDNFRDEGSIFIGPPT